jgi:transglutaminase-like putative cysteine protease
LSPTDFLAPTRFVDSDHPDVIAFARAAVHGAETERERAMLLFRAARDVLRYDPYSVTFDPDDYVASRILKRERSYCVPKAIVLCAAARAVGIPARLGFADVKNHLSSEKLLATLGTDLFVFHGYVELWIGGQPRKASPAFNASLCARFGVPPLELTGEGDALLQAYDGSGKRMMEYVAERGLYVDLPFETIMRAYAETYGPRVMPAAAYDEAFHEPD